MNFRSRLAAFAGLAASALLAGCNLLPEAQPDRARYYVLENPAAVATPAATGAVRLGLRPVEVPAYLKNKAIATRTGASEVRYATEAFWAEPLEAGLARVVRERLVAHAVVVPYPFPAQLQRDYDVTLRVLSAEGARDGLQFRAVIEIVRVGEPAELVARRDFTAPATAWNGDYAALARELAHAATSFADEVAAALPKR